jgi:hypothetical protein
MQNTDGYDIVTVAVEKLEHSGGMVHFTTNIGSFGLIVDRFQGAVFSGETVTLYMLYNEVVGVQTSRGIAFYVKPEEYEDYTKTLMERSYGARTPKAPH